MLPVVSSTMARSRLRTRRASMPGTVISQRDAPAAMTSVTAFFAPGAITVALNDSLTGRLSHDGTKTARPSLRVVSSALATPFADRRTRALPIGLPAASLTIIASGGPRSLSASLPSAPFCANRVTKERNTNGSTLSSKLPAVTMPELGPLSLGTADARSTPTTAAARAGRGAAPTSGLPAGDVVTPPDSDLARALAQPPLSSFFAHPHPVVDAKIHNAAISGVARIGSPLAKGCGPVAVDSVSAERRIELDGSLVVGGGAAGVALPRERDAAVEIGLGEVWRQLDRRG